MIERIIISGFGGQGVMFLGKLISWAAMRENKFVTFLPAYGAEVRGGTSHCSIIISDKEIASPCVEQTDTLIAMNQPSVDKFIGLAKKMFGGLYQQFNGQGLTGYYIGPA